MNVARHPLEAPRIALLHDWTDTQEDGWFRITLDQLKIPYTYIADTKVRETSNLRDQFDVIIVPPFAGELARVIQGLPMQGPALPWKNTPETPSFVAPGLDESDDIRGGLGYSGVAGLERFVREGGLLIAVGDSVALPVEGGMTRAVSLRPSQKLVCPGDVLLADVEDGASPIAYGYGEKLYLYYSQNPILNISLGFGGGGAEDNASRSSGRGSATDPDVIQGRPYSAPEKPPKRTPREKELYVPEEVRAYASWLIPPAKELPRVILRFAKAGDLLVSGLLDGSADLAEKPAVVDVPHGQGHIVLFSNNPMWRNETSGSYFLLFNAVMNYRHLDVGQPPSRLPSLPAKGEPGMLRILQRLEQLLDVRLHLNHGGSIVLESGDQHARRLTRRSHEDISRLAVMPRMHAQQRMQGGTRQRIHQPVALMPRVRIFVRPQSPAVPRTPPV